MSVYYYLHSWLGQIEFHSGGRNVHLGQKLHGLALALYGYDKIPAEQALAAIVHGFATETDRPVDAGVGWNAEKNANRIALMCSFDGNRSILTLRCCQK